MKAFKVNLLENLLIIAFIVCNFAKSGQLVPYYGQQHENSVQSAEPTCPTEGRTNITFRNLCEMYTVCEDGRLHLETCPDGLYYNQRKKICDLRIHVPYCEPLDKHAPSTAKPSRRLIQKIKQNFECDPLDVIVKKLGPKRCRVQVICANGVSFVMRRCLQTISFRV